MHLLSNGITKERHKLGVWPNATRKKLKEQNLVTLDALQDDPAMLLMVEKISRVNAWRMVV